MTYRFLAYDLRANTALGELPLTGVKFGGALNQAGPFSATLRTSPETAALFAAATTPERTVIFVERDGSLLDGYVVWQRTRKTGAPIELRGASLGSLLRRNRIVTTLGPYTAVDQFTIARAIVDAVQAQPGANFGFVTTGSASGVTRDRTYYAYERKNAGDALAQLAAVDNGFDWAIDVAWSAGVPAKTLTLSYPRRGRSAGSTGLVFESGKNLLSYTMQEDGTRSARAVDTLGAGDGADMLISTGQRTDLIDAGYPLTAEVLSYKDVKVRATLDAHALAAVNARAATPTFLTVEVAADDVEAGLGSWIVGDDALVRITDDQFPLQADGRPGYERYHRIIGWSVDVPDVGMEAVAITFGQVAP